MHTECVDNKQLNIRLDPDYTSRLKAFADQLEMTPGALAGYLMRAAIRAAEREDVFRLPVEFNVREPVPSSRHKDHYLNEPQATSQKHR
jgi:hypothetical protein